MVSWWMTLWTEFGSKWRNVFTLGRGSSRSPSSSLLSLEWELKNCILSYFTSCHNHTSSWLTNHSTLIANTNLRVSISMFISGLLTTLAVVGPDTFIDEARFSIRRCLSLSLSSPSFQYKLLSCLDVWKFDSLSSKYRRQLKNVWGGLRLPRL